MRIDEGGVPAGSLAEYYSRKAEEAKKQAAPVAQGQTEQIAQPIAVLRAHLEELDAPLRDLFFRFRVIDLLEEVRTKYWTQSVDGVVRKIGEVKETSPQPSKTTYGLELSGYYDYSERVDTYDYIPGGKTYYIDRIVGETSGKSIKIGSVPRLTRVFRIINIESGAPRSTDSESEYSLRYRYFQEEEIAANINKYWVNYEGLGTKPHTWFGPLKPKTEQVIRADQQLEILVKLIGDDVRRTVSIPGIPKE